MLQKSLRPQSKKALPFSHGHSHMRPDVIDTARGYILTGKTSQRLKLDNLPVGLNYYLLIYASHILHIEALSNHYV